MINSHYGPHRSMDRPQSSTQAFRSLPCSKWDLPPQPSKTERTLRISKTLRYESKQPSSNLSKEAFHQSPLQSQSQRNASAATWSASRRRWHLRSGGLRATALVRLHVAGFAPPCRPAIRRVGRTGSWRKSTEGEGKEEHGFSGFRHRSVLGMFWGWAISFALRWYAHVWTFFLFPERGAPFVGSSQLELAWPRTFRELGSEVFVWKASFLEQLVTRVCTFGSFGPQVWSLRWVGGRNPAPL